MGRNLENRDTYQSFIWCDLHPTSIPVRNGDRVTGELSRGDELPNVFLETSRWLKPLHENILQAGHHFCPNDSLLGSRDTSPWIDRDYLPQEMGVRVPTIGCPRWHHSSKLDVNIGAWCRGPLSWNGDANRTCATDESCQSGSMHEIFITESIKGGECEDGGVIIEWM